MVIDTTLLKTQMSGWITNRKSEAQDIVDKITNAVQGGNPDLLPPSLREARRNQIQSHADLTITESEIIEAIEKAEQYWTMLGN